MTPACVKMDRKLARRQNKNKSVLRGEKVFQMRWLTGSLRSRHGERDCQEDEVSEVATSDSKPWAFCDPNADVIEIEIIQVDWP